MILVKSLILLFSILLSYYLYNRFYQTTKKCPGIEGFNNNLTNKKERQKDEAKDEAKPELNFRGPSTSIVENHNSVSNDASMINELQLKIDSLIKLSHEASKIKVKQE